MQKLCTTVFGFTPVMVYSSNIIFNAIRSVSSLMYSYYCVPLFQVQMKQACQAYQVTRCQRVKLMDRKALSQSVKKLQDQYMSVKTLKMIFSLIITLVMMSLPHLEERKERNHLLKRFVNDILYSIGLVHINMISILKNSSANWQTVKFLSNDS